MPDALTDSYSASVGRSGLDARWIVVDERFAATLATTHRRTLEAAAVRTASGDDRFTPDVPNLDPVRTKDLDEEGVVRVGTRVGPGDLLVGKASPRPGSPVSKEEQLVGALFGETPEILQDTSLRVPPSVAGVVIAARSGPGRAEHELAAVEVVIEWEEPLEVGDELRADDRTVTVCGIRPLATDVELDGVGDSVAVAKWSVARDVLHARHIGPYSVVTQQALEGRDRFGGQRLERVQARALIADAPTAVAEMLTLKSDSVTGRFEAYKALVLGEDPDPFAASGEEVPPLMGTPIEHSSPDAVHALHASLVAAGFDVPMHAEPIRVHWLTEDAIRERSRGEVRSSETLSDRTHRPQPDGLFCPRIFGPVEDHRCECGQVEGIPLRGTICEACGVECTRSAVRRERFGHVELVVPVVHPWLVPSIAVLLGREPEWVERVARGQTPLEPSDAEEPSFDDTGGSAIARALVALDLEAIDATEAGPRADLACALLAEGLEPAELLLRALPVLPPDLRPLVPLDDGRYATSDLNDLYRRVINRNDRLRRLLELDAPALICCNELGKLHGAVHELLANEYTPRPVHHEGRTLRSLLSHVVRQRDERLTSKCVDYSGVARLVVDPGLGPGECRMPRTMAMELFRPWTYCRLEAQGLVTSIKAAKQRVVEEHPDAVAAMEHCCEGYPLLLMCDERVVSRRLTLWEHPALAVDARTAERLGGTDVVVHVPLSRRAREECTALGDFPMPTPPVREGWLTRLLLGADPIETVRTALFERDSDDLLDPLIRVALGRGHRTT